MTDARRILFLDVDGVLNNMTTKERWDGHSYGPQVDAEWGFTGIDSRIVPIFNRLIRQTGALVVVSSTWRLDTSVEELSHVFAGFGMWCEIVGFTPNMRRRPGGWDPYGDTWTVVPRAHEIKAWLDANVGSYESFAIVDDDPSAAEKDDDLFTRSVLTDPDVGLTAEDASKLEEILLTPLRSVA